jgi:hypothetical protein
MKGWQQTMKENGKKAIWETPAFEILQVNEYTGAGLIGFYDGLSYGVFS